MTPLRSSRQFIALLLSAVPVFAADAPLPTPEEIVAHCVQAGERTWRAIAKPPAGLSSRELFAYALALCEGKAKLERLEKLFDTAALMHDRDPQSRGYGNFRWSWSHEGVWDFNAVDFCMQNGALLWMRHRDTMPAAARDKLRPILELAGEGLLRHRVAESYTNIALMNAGNLILLGEAMGKPELADEGYARLDRICLYMSQGGTHEYCSPTYYGTDLDDLVLIEAFCRRESGRAQARALLELFWTDIALNWFPPAQKLGGARSRDYDYLRGLGFLDQQMMANGWLPATEKQRVGSISTAFIRWRPPTRLKTLSETKFPRLVTQVWGMEKGQSRTHHLCRDVTLSAAGTGYGGRMDLPLCADLPGDREGVRCYFIPDGRHDPYGKIKIQESQAHAKTLHLQPFWTAAQRRVDALGLAVYRDKDVPPETQTLESHFVMPLVVDGFWIGERRVEFQPGKAAEFPLKSGEAVVLRKGTAAVGVRVPWARDLAGHAATAALVYDANTFGAVRLTVTHHVAQPGAAKTNAAAAFWVRIGSGLASDGEFANWRRQFAAAKADVEASPERVRIGVAGVDGPVAASAAAPFVKSLPTEPPPPRALLACDGDDIGDRLLRDLEPVKTYRAKRAAVVPVAVPTDKDVYWEAEAGDVMPPMSCGEDAAASGGQFVWMPAKPGERGGSRTGCVTWDLRVEKAGKYYLWGRVLAPTPENDSFYLHAFTDAAELIEPTTWPTGTRKQWQWTRVTLERTKPPMPIALPAGSVSLQLRVREAGTKIDRLFLTPQAAAEPR
ncbi:MAG: hypothetical protein NTY01_21760 [Verrucomicrobia bacterium]|nr:hypothetical protein [Verrucomicrobiota bacterium]